NDRHRGWWGPQGYVDYRGLHRPYGDRVRIESPAVTYGNSAIVNPRPAWANTRFDLYHRDDNARRVADPHALVRAEPGAAQPAPPRRIGGARPGVPADAPRPAPPRNEEPPRHVTPAAPPGPRDDNPKRSEPPARTSPPAREMPPARVNPPVGSEPPARTEPP